MSRPPLTRSSTDRMVGGVAGGLARHLGVDPIVVRVAFAVVTLFWGLGLIVYLALLIFVPSDDGESLAPTSRAGIILTVVGGIVAVAVLDGDGWGLFFPLGGLLVGSVLLVAGVVLWRSSGGAGAGAKSTAARLGRAAMVVGSIMVAGTLGIAAAFAAALGAGAIVAGVVIACGVGLIVAAFAGGGRWLIVPALLLATPLTIVAAADVEIDGGIGEHAYRPGSVETVRDRYELGIGELRLDLREVKFPAGTTQINVDLGVGDVQIRVPEGLCVAHDIKVGAGYANVLGRETGGFDVDDEYSPPTTLATTPVLMVEGDLGVGAIEIHRDGFFGRDDRGPFEFRDDDAVDLEDQRACE